MKTNTKTNIKVLFFILTALNAILALYSVSALAHESDLGLSEAEEIRAHEEMMAQDEELYQDDFELLPEEFVMDMKGCTKASSSQLATVNKGNARRTEFQNACMRATGSSTYCAQVERPNPASKSIFACTYGASQVHRLIHPSSSTWKNATKAIQLLQKLSAKGICISQIYNWWRPEPYNANVGGAAGRHPLGTSVDVRFCTNSDAIKGFDELCKYRKAGEVRALGYYGSTGVHIGVGDNTANTWGRTCK
jgi:hypothetical protein